MSSFEDIGESPLASAASLGEALRAARKRQGLTQEELAEIARISRPHLVQIEKGKTTERLEQIFRLARLLGLELIVRPRGRRRTG